MCTHEIEVYEPANFSGQNPIHANSIGVVKTRDRNEFFLLDLEKPFEYKGNTVSQLILRPRYYGDKIQRVTRDMCTVNIMYVKPDSKISTDEYMQLTDVGKWGCGKINPSRNS
ncbi:MAG: hypothetical protein L3J62_04185 [Gammaproteobacteria bacterium]|nr:hypothetical protein [Gammaproteobacteria bacterium]MCF6229982.1 hypothetical protein [Gammaproteobacteria bacterium]